MSINKSCSKVWSLGISFVRQDPRCRDKLFASGFGFVDFLAHWERVQEINLLDLCKPCLLQIRAPVNSSKNFCHSLMFSSPSCNCCFKPFSTAVTISVLMSPVLCLPQRFPVCATFNNSSAMHREFVNNPISLRTYTSSWFNG